MEDIETNTVVVGGGQAGLSTSYYLKQNKIDHLVLEQADKPAYAWRELRWESFCFVIPNWTIRLPGGWYSDFGINPDGFILKNDLIAYFEEYIKRHNIPIVYNSRVLSINKTNQDWSIETSNKRYRAKNVVVATGFFQIPKIPMYASKISKNVYQAHTTVYKNPDELNEGSVFVVGTGQSGMQIAEEIYKTGRKVHLSVGTTGRIPRRYRGKDIVHWWEKIGGFSKKVNTLDSPRDRLGSNPHLSGADGGHDLNLHQFFKDGVSLYGHLKDISAENQTIHFNEDLHDLIKKNDEFEDKILTTIDEYISENEQVNNPPTRNEMTNAFNQEIVTELDMQKENITNVIWATGYNRDFSMIKVDGPVIDEMGYPIQKRGVTQYDGLYFIGLPWLDTPGSGLLYGVGADAEHIVAHMINRN